MTIFELLDHKKAKRTSFLKSEEYKNYVQHRDKLLAVTKFSNFHILTPENEFMIIRANIIIQGLLNKEAIEKESECWRLFVKDGKFDRSNFISTFKTKIIDCPYFTDGENKIYIPFFPKSLNLIYANEPEKLIDEPYLSLRKDFSGSIVDAFDTYGALLFDSYFSRLVKIGTNGSEVAYFHYDTNKIYVVNEQGRLDCTITLFDKYLKKPSYSHMLERIQPVVDAFFGENRELFIDTLYKNNFISSKMAYLIKHRVG